MRKVIIIGSPGAGKSTFARKLRDRTGLPLYYLDMLWHRPDQTNVSIEEFDAKLGDILHRGEWIVDGNYMRTLEWRLSECDTAFFLDYPPEICLSGAAARVGREREDMPWVEAEFDPEFRRWIEDFPRNQLPRIQELLAKYREGREIILFRSRGDADDYLKKLR